MARYKFLDHWNIKAPIDQVIHYLAAPRTYLQRWSAYDNIKVLPRRSP